MLTYLLLTVLTNVPMYLSVLVGGVGILPFTPSLTPIYAVISFLLSRSEKAAPENITSSAATGGVTIRVLPVKAVITLRVPTRLTSIGSSSTASYELPFTCRAQVFSTLTDKPNEVISSLALQCRV